MNRLLITCQGRTIKKEFSDKELSELLVNTIGLSEDQIREAMVMQAQLKAGKAVILGGSVWSLIDNEEQWDNIIV